MPPLLLRLQALALAGFVLSLFPWSVAALFFNYALLALDLRTPTLRGHLRRNQAFQRRNILITGIERPTGLHLARSFYYAGHNVTAAATATGLLPLHARFSAVLVKFYGLKHGLNAAATASASASEVSKEILDIVLNDNIDLWIDVSQPTLSSNLRHAGKVVERGSRALVFVPSDERYADILASSDSLLSYAHDRGLPSLDIHQVGSRSEIHDVLNTSRGKKRYRLSGPFDDDDDDEDEDDDATTTTTTAATQKKNTVLPRRTLSQTYHEVAQIKVQKSSPLQLKQYVEGQERYTTSSVVVRGRVQAFAASPRSFERDPRFLYSLPPRSATKRALRSYVGALARSLGPDFTGHLSIDFVTDEIPSSSGVERLHFPVHAQLDPGLALLLFQGLHGHVALARAYLEAVASVPNGIASHADGNSDDNDEDDDYDDSRNNTRTETEALIYRKASRGVYSLGYDVSRLAIEPLKQLLAFKIGIIGLLGSLATLANHILSGQEYVYDFRDPLPFWWLYQVYLPLALVRLAVQPSGNEPASLRLQSLSRSIGWR